MTEELKQLRSQLFNFSSDLHAAQAKIYELRSERDRLREVNAELGAALNGLMRIFKANVSDVEMFDEWFCATDAIAKATKE